MTPREVMLAQFGRADDPESGGRQMPAHYGGAAHRIYTSSSPVGTQALHAAGIALAAKLRCEPQVAVVTMGEGASNQGDVHEALNFAGIHRLPMVLVVENNGYAISVPAEKEVAVRDVAVRAAGYDMPGVIVEGTDVLGCYLAMRDAVARALAGDGPTLIEAKVTRLTGHSSDDQQSKYRTEADLAEGRGRDPLPAFRDELRAAGVLDASTEAAIAAEVDPATLTCHVYAEPAEVSTPAMPATPATSTAPAPPSGRERN